MFVFQRGSKSRSTLIASVSHNRAQILEPIFTCRPSCVRETPCRRSKLFFTIFRLRRLSLYPILQKRLMQGDYLYRDSATKNRISGTFSNSVDSGMKLRKNSIVDHRLYYPIFTTENEADAFGQMSTKSSHCAMHPTRLRCAYRRFLLLLRESTGN